jgi:hypothetical protein
MPQWVEPAGGEERKSGGEKKSAADVEQKIVMLIYPYPISPLFTHFGSINCLFIISDLVSDTPSLQIGFS